jgi:DNA polymerase-1
MIVTTENYQEVIDNLLPNKSWIVDVETNGFNAFTTNQLCGIGIGAGEETYYFPFRHQQGGNLVNTKYLKPLMEIMSQRESLIGYNIKFDLKFLEKEGLDITNIKLIDVLVMVRLTEPTTIRDLDLTTTIIRNYGEEAGSYDIETKKVLKTNKWHKDFSLAPVDILGEYCEQDVKWTAKLYEDRLLEIQESGQEDVFELECDLTKVLNSMEHRGIPIDLKYARNLIEKLDKRKNEVEKKVQVLLDDSEINIGSTKQLGEALNKRGIKSPVKTPKGKQSWNEEALSRINNPIAGLVRQYRTLDKLKSTYVESLLEPEEISILHTSFCNWGTLTGRLSSRDPNLQNIPRNHFKLSDRKFEGDERKDIINKINASLSAKGKEPISHLDDEVLDTWGFIGDESFDENDPKEISIRRLFVPREDYKLISFDYSQMEVRVFLSYLGNPNFDDLLKRGDLDFHSEAAKLAFNVSENHPNFKTYRQAAKAITFGVIYGIGNARLAAQLGTSVEEAKQYKQNYFKNIEGSRLFINTVMQKVQEEKHLYNKYKRLYVIEPKFAYKGINYLVQGTSADILSERMIAVHKYLQDKKSNMLLQVHDEIICEIHADELHTVTHEIKNLLETNTLDIPLQVDVEVCEPSWASKQEVSFVAQNGLNWVIGGILEKDIPVEETKVEDFIDWDTVEV